MLVIRQISLTINMCFIKTEFLVDEERFRQITPRKTLALRPFKLSEKPVVHY